ncbi:MAG: S41 family peptidase [Syntrophaceae bacterium]
MKFNYRGKTPSVVALAIILSLFFIFGPASDSKVDAVDPAIYKNLKVFNEALDMIEKNYVEKVEPKNLIQEAINGMMKSLDPHSSYLNAEMYKELQSDTRGSFGGIGIEITMQNDVLTVVSPIEDTPAFNAGVKAGDQIVRIDDKSTKGISILDAVKKLRGPENSKVKITIMRKGLTQPKDYVISRAVINIKSVKNRNYDGNIGYIRVSSFQERTTDDVKRALAELKKKGAVDGLVIDVRNNPGGLLDQAVKVSDIFLKSGTIVSIMGRSKSLESKFVAKDDGSEPACPIVVLVNEGSASAAEIVAGALQDNGKAIVLGTQSFGKGSVQTVIPFEDGSALKLTTARYYTPKGKSIQAEGITPDIAVEYIKPPEEKEAEVIIRERDLKGHIRGEHETEQTETKEVKTRTIAKRNFDDISKDNQLKSAVDLLKSWEIFSKLHK